MGESLPHCLIKKIILFSALLLGMAVQGAYSQSLSAGDVAFTGFNADDPDGFAVAIFKSLSAGQEIHFSEGPWDGSAFDSGAGDLTWVAPAGGISAGTVLSFSDVNGTPSVNIGSIIDDANINLSGTSSVIYAYTGIDKSSPDSPLLGAAANSVDEYNGTEGTLTGTGLTQGVEAVLLSDAIDVHQFIGSRDGNTQNGYQTELNDNSNWEEANGTGSQVDEILPFNTQTFTIVSVPTVAFTSSTLLADEDGTSVDLTVELVEANSTAVDVDVVFLSGSSSANGSDISSYTTETVSFGSDASSGDTQTVTITLNNDGDFEGIEKAVFQLQNNTAGSIIEPDVLTLTINDDDTPDIVINEILFDPDGDANGDGVTDTSDDEFVELINNSSNDIDVSGWQLFDGAGDKYTFPSGSVIPANRAFVVFAGSANVSSGDFGGALLYAGGSLGLNNGSDNVIIKDASGTVIVSHSYSSGGNNQSITRDPDITGGFTDHISADEGDDSSPYSPGTQIDGSPFGSKHAIGIRGTEGWRMISSPVQNATFSDFFGDFWMQGVTGSNDPSGTGTLFSWTESGGGAFSAPSDMSGNLTPGQGYIVYVFEDDEYNTPGIQGGFPKVVNSDGTENSGTVDVSVSATDEDGSGSIDSNEGWNMLGNPFDADLSVTAILDALENVDASVNANIYVWDHEADGGNGDWVTKTDGDLLAPFQGFFVRFTSAFSSTNASFDKSTLEANEGTEFYKDVAEDAFQFNLELHGDQYFDTYSLEFNDKGTADLDRYDAYKLFSLNPNSINLFSTISDNQLQKNVLPRDMESLLEIPLSFEVGDRETLTFRWGNTEQLPEGWQFVLIDTEMNREIDIRAAEDYQFNKMVTGQRKPSNEETLLNKSSGEEQDTRFILSVQPKKEQKGSTELPESAKLNPNYPNPFNPQTTIPFELSEDAEVKLTVWNMIGQKVATLVDGFVEAGTHEESWNASNMPSGMYIARFEVGNEVFIRKMTLIK